MEPSTNAKGTDRESPFAPCRKTLINAEEDTAMKTAIAPFVAAALLFGSSAWAAGNPDLYGSPLLDGKASAVSQVHAGQGDMYASILLDTAPAERTHIVFAANSDLYGCPITGTVVR
jgi:hypothetical protein